MFKAILDMYQSSCDARKLAFKEKIKSIQISKGDPIITYLSKFTWVWDELCGVGVTVASSDLVSLALLGLHKSWENFQDVVSGRENIPNLERLWSDYVQEEIQRGARVGRSTLEEDEENFSLTGNGSKAKVKKGQGEAESNPKGEKKKDLNEIKCFHFHEFRHYAIKCLNQEESNKDHVARLAEVDVFPSKFEKDFSLIACMESSTNSIVWYINSVASFHMTGNKEYFSHLKEDMQFQIELGNDGKCTNRGAGTDNFERDSGSSLHLEDVLYVLGLKRNLVSVTTLEDKGYDVIFSRGKAYLKHLTYGCKKQIVVRKKNLYLLQFETGTTLSSNIGSAQSRDMRVEESKVLREFLG